LEKKRPRAEKRGHFLSVSIKNAKSSGAKEQHSNINQISKYFMFVLFGPNTNFLDPTVLEI
jgi:hypothetical protein